jgi:hypothetical protein
MKTIRLLMVSSLFLLNTANDTVPFSRTRSTAAVTLAASVIKVKNSDSSKKYPRKECPVCKGQGWYISGDGIKKVDCGYCIPDKKSDGAQSTSNNKTLNNCVDGSCEPKSILRR